MLYFNNKLKMRKEKNLNKFSSKSIMTTIGNICFVFNKGQMLC